MAAGVAGMLIGVSPAVSQAEINVGVGIGRHSSFVINTRPTFIYVPDLGFTVAVGSPYDYYYYDNFYYIYDDGYWYNSSYYNGPWIGIDIGRLPSMLRRHGIEDIRRKLPAWIATQDRAVSGSDYKTFADQFATPYHGQIGKSVAVLRNQGCARNIIDLYVLANNGGILETASNGLKVDLLDALNDVKMLTDFVCIKDGSIVSVDIGITATLNKFYKNYQDDIRQDIVNKTNAFFSINNWEYGQPLRSIDLVKALSSITQVESFEITFHLPANSNLQTEVYAKFYEIIRPDTGVPISVNFI